MNFILFLTGTLGLAQSVPSEQREPVNQQPSAGSQNQQTQPAGKATPEQTPQPASQGSGTNTTASEQQPAAELPQSPSPKNTSPSDAVQETQGQSSSQQQDSTHKPIGTAAAEKEKASGIAASNPAGTAIAPAKQRHSRAFFIKVGAALAAGVAVGTAMALSRSSPSTPPGSH